MIYLVVPSKTGGGWEVEPRAGGSASFAAAAAMATHELGVAGRRGMETRSSGGSGLLVSAADREILCLVVVVR